MEQFVQKVNAVLEDAFPEVEVMLAVRKGLRKVGGLLIWTGFAGKSQLERQAEVWEVLRTALSSDEQLNLGTILTVSPQEVAAMEDVAVAA
ncbi:MAG: hypothetical protein M3Y28_02175 [Armatimonadota bacterium]|nr:hypothetical protein [Armatimonadota bacterium]